MNHPLDGKYSISSTATLKGDIEKRSDGETEIKNGQTQRIDDAGCKWTSTFTIISDTEVRMVSVADPSEAAVDFLLTRPDGSPTRDNVTYESVLKLARKKDAGSDRVQMSGQIHYGNDVVFLTLRKK